MTRGLTVVALGVSTFLLAVAPAGATPMWLAPAKLSADGQNAETPQVSVDAQGDALTVWKNSATKVVEAASRPAGAGSWQTPVKLSSTTEAFSPQVGLDSRGDAVAAWVSFDGAEYTIQAASRSGLNGSWQPAVTLSKLGATTVMDVRPDLAVNAQGNAVVVWQRYNGGEIYVEAASGLAGGSWQAPETLSKAAEAMQSAEVGIDARGDATAVWEETGTGETLIGAASKPSGGKWQATPTLISRQGAGEHSNVPRVAVDAQGDAVAVWERFEGEEIIEAASKPASSGTWQPSVEITNPAVIKEPANQQVAIDGQGDAVVTWSWINAAKHDIVEATVGKATTSVWQTPTVLSGPGSVVEEAPQVGVNEQGNAVVVWERPNGASEIVEAATGLAASGSWQAPVALSAAGQNASEPQVSLDAQGNAVAVWKRFDGTSYIAEAANYVIGAPLQILPPITGPTPIVKPLPLIFVAPKITGARVSPSRFRVSKRTTAISSKARPKAKVPQGATFHFTLSEQAKLQIAFTRSAPGLRSGKRCVAPSAKLRSHHAKRCTRTLTVGTLTRANERQGADSLLFSGRIGNKPLAPGKYKAVLTANAAGLTSAAVTLSLTVVR